MKKVNFIINIPGQLTGQQLYLLNVFKTERSIQATFLSRLACPSRVLQFDITVSIFTCLLLTCASGSLSLAVALSSL